MLVNKEQGDHLGLQEPRERKEDRYAELVLSNYASNQHNIWPRTFSLSSYMYMYIDLA